MLGNREKMVVIPPKTNEWPQSQVDDQKVLMVSSGRVMEKPGQELLQQQQEAFKCPRCDSSNTKFCYYNNYSLSQPRHFCKACKRYWTRGGTLRNVPVGGGCRKNKRVKRPVTSAMDTAPSSSLALTANSNPSSQAQIDIASTSSHINPLFYGLPSNSCDMNLPFPRFNSRVYSVDTVSGYDLQPQMNALGLDFPSGIMSSEASVNNDRNGFYLNNTLLSSYNSIFGSSSTSPPTSPIMASLLNSTLQQQKFVTGGEAEMVALKEAKSDEGQNRLGWNGVWHNPEHMGLSDPPLYWNEGTAMGAWNDQTNIGPSVTSLI